MSDLTDKWRTKFPGSYDDLSDSDLESAILAKHPEYQDLAGKPGQDSKSNKSTSLSGTDAPAKPSAKIEKPADAPDTSDKTPKSEDKPESLASKLWGYISKPLTTIPSELASKVADKIDEPSLDNEHPMLKGFAAGATKGFGDLVSGFTSPLNLAGMIAPEIEALGAAKHLPAIGMAAHGAYNLVRPGASMQERLMSLPEIAGGLHGSGLLDHAPDLSPEQVQTQSKSLPPIQPKSAINAEIPPELQDFKLGGQFTAPEDVIPDKSGDQPAPKTAEEKAYESIMGKQLEKRAQPESSNPQQALSLPDLSKASPEDLKAINDFMGNGQDDPELQRLKDIITKDNTGKDLPTAEYAGNQNGEPQFTVKGGRLDGSTVSAETLNKNGIRTPEFDPNAPEKQQGMSVDDIFNKSQSKPALSFNGKSGTAAKAESIFPTENAHPDITQDRQANPDKPRYRLDNKSGGMIPIDANGVTIGPTVYPKTGDIEPVPSGKQQDLGFETLSEKLQRLKGNDSGSGGNNNNKPPIDQGSFDFHNPPPKPGEKLTASDRLQQIYDTPRGMMSVDLPFMTSAAFRQASPLVGTQAWFKAWIPAAKAFGSKAASDAIQSEIANRPNFQLGEQSKLSLSDLGSFTRREEALRSGLAEKIPIYGKYIAASNRAYTTFLNSLRANHFDTLIKDATDQGLNPKNNINLSKQIAEFVNTATGRGSLSIEAGQAPGNGSLINLEQHTRLLSNTLFAPKRVASEVRMLNPNTYIMADPFVRQQYLASVLRRVGTWWTVANLAQLAGAKVEQNMNSPDYGKIKIGDTRIDPPGGLQQYLVLGNQLRNQSKTSSTTGKVTSFGGFNAPTTGSDVGQFAENRLHPTAKFIYDAATANQSSPFHIGDRLAQLVVPMYATDLAKVIKTDPSLAPLIIPAGAGMGMQTYGKGSKISDPSISPIFNLDKYDMTLGGKPPKHPQFNR